MEQKQKSFIRLSSITTLLGKVNANYCIIWKEIESEQDVILFCLFVRFFLFFFFGKNCERTKIENKKKKREIKIEGKFIEDIVERIRVFVNQLLIAPRYGVARTTGTFVLFFLFHFDSVGENFYFYPPFLDSSFLSFLFSTQPYGIGWNLPRSGISWPEKGRIEFY